MNPIGVYWSVMHRRPQDYEYFKRLQPSVFKIMDGGPNDYAWAKANLPNSLVIARDWALSEQHQDMRRDPVGTGRRHAEEWDAHADRLGFDRAKTLILGINEPQVWESGVPEALRQYTIALCDRAAELDLRVGAMQLSVGWPANNGPDTPPDWSPFAGVEDAIRRGNHMLVCHEYWADSGPDENWGWWAGRALRCPWRVPIVIGECGIDMYVKDPSVPHTARGWQGRMHPTRYAAELAEYVTRMDTDARFVGACVFASDFANREWWSFDVEPAYDAILATRNPSNVGRNDPSVPGAGHKAYLPHVGNQQSNSNSSSNPQPSPEVEPPKKNAMSSNSGAIDPLVLEAIIKVESGGQAYGPDGRPLIRFEAHIFLARQGHNRFRHNTDKPWTGQQVLLDGWRDIHTGSQQDEYNAFEIARAANARAAYESISVGLGQIMGFNHARIGYPSAEAMYNAFARSETAQVIGLINFFLSDPQLTQAARSKDWRTIARLYNGPGDVDRVAPLLQRTYEGLRNA